MAITQFPFDTDQPKVRVKLPVGVHVLQLVVEDNAGLRSAPTRVTVVVERAGVEIESISPTGGHQGEKVSVTVFGKKLAAVTKVAFGGEGLTVSELSAAETAVRFTLAIAADAAPGPRTFKLYTQQGELLSPLGVAFTVGVVVVGPSIKDIQPRSGKQGDTLAVRITGERLANTTSVAFEGGGIGVVLDPTPSETQINLSLRIDRDAKTGPRAFTVITPTGKAQSPVDKPFGIEEQAVAHRIETIDPHGGYLGEKVNVKVTGVGLGGPQEVVFDDPGMKYVVGSLYASDREVSFSIHLDDAFPELTSRLHHFVLRHENFEVQSPSELAFAVVERDDSFCCMEPRSGSRGETFHTIIVGDYRAEQITNIVFSVDIVGGGSTIDHGIAVAKLNSSYDRVEFEMLIANTAGTGPRSVTLATLAGQGVIHRNVFTVNL